MIGFPAWGHGRAVKLARRPADSETPADAQERQGSSRDFDDLVHQHLDFVWRLLRRFGLSSADADDVAQGVFMIAARKLGDLPPGNERKFLYGTARRLAANARRDTRRRHEVPSDSVEAPNASGSPPDDRVDIRRAAQLLDELLERMPEELSRVLVLAELEEETVPAIAELEGIPAGTAASRLRRAREAFGKLLARVAERNPFGGRE